MVKFDPIITGQRALIYVVGSKEDKRCRRPTLRKLVMTAQGDGGAERDPLMLAECQSLVTGAAIQHLALHTVPVVSMLTRCGRYAQMDF